MKIRAHETFCIRKGWLHKGVKNIVAHPRLFTDKEQNPCDILGIGANMVKSLRYWMNAVGIMEEVYDGNIRIQRLSEFGTIIDRYDRYYEEDGTNWAVHYMLVKNKEQATAWYWFFNVFKLNTCDKALFVKELDEYIHTDLNSSCSTKMLEDEFDCIVKTYYSKEDNSAPENTMVCPLTELHLIEQNPKNKDYKKCVPDRDSLHPLIVFGAICDWTETDEILISDIMNKEGSVAKIFNFDRATCFFYLEQLNKMGYLNLNRTAGLDVVTINHRLSFNESLVLYYRTINGELEG